jgi:hypothetical protein
VNFSLRTRYWFLIVPLLFAQRNALRRDLTFLKDAIEAHDSAYQKEPS